MRVKWLRKALHNLDEEAAHIATDDAAAARLVVGRILDSGPSLLISLALAALGVCLERAN
jgi:toxin ParE1/3/4